MEENEGIQPKRQPAVTISIQSWATPIVGAVMLILGLLGGYYGSPLIGGEKEQAAVPRLSAPAQAEGPGDGNQELMEYLLSQIRHFRGDPNASVAVVEFGDFQ
ncbi:MAG: hypothetical protein ISR59_05420 [Anaerolineales bacterium]|uniref:Uncharacterized protein n=1 Tax=Candidatus Desulfolinea nitratireducens TaxID=2841698 RepID=A0A8J6NM51_9CHLR|nr:hypothetical protein [Candidatus Desulfolinea nitratireducens]MBL6960528.1 hypothetical protein [Anaerolineales bacterium]